MRGAAGALAALVLLAGCGTPTSTTVTIGEQTFTVEVADTPDAQRAGLSDRDDVPTGTGMLFPFEEPGPREVWMARTRVPLDIAWILDGQVLAVKTLPPCELDAVTNCPTYPSPGDVDTLLEVRAGELAGVSICAEFEVEPGVTYELGRP
ncbi:DUF192 domain-containing protein [Oerskovia sp. Sa1BUA8]|uniref:DUF192 domain-containing protein n=1 Tax=Oerskovia douganii TaxID=2762210 RepID=A0A9D5UCP2_9CELL|nr:DUF192 domain-containing protein [Oerskovia douganii]MBE7702268.1 DUF192 domain-containing protein [Oerskovia douganii]